MSASDWSELDGYEALVSELRANPPVAPERLRQRVLEGAPAPRRQRSGKRKLVLVVVPAAIVLAVGAALVHGFVSSGSHSNATVARSAVLGLNPDGRVPDSKAKKLYPNLQKVKQSQKGTFQTYKRTDNTAALAGAPAAVEALPSVRR